MHREWCFQLKCDEVRKMQMKGVFIPNIMQNELKLQRDISRVISDIYVEGRSQKFHEVEYSIKGHKAEAGAVPIDRGLQQSMS